MRWLKKEDSKANRIAMTIADGWQRVDSKRLPDGLLLDADASIDLVLAVQPAHNRIAANLVVLHTPIPPGEDPSQALRDSATILATSIPGMHMLDDCQWPINNTTWSGRVRTGVYILDNTSLTVVQWAWVLSAPEGTCLWTATMTSPTREFPERWNEVIPMIQSLEVRR